MGLSSTVSLTANGLQVAQRATQVVAGNISAASSDGYTAKTLSVAGIYTEDGLVGFRTSVSRAYDQEVYDQLIAATGSTSYLETKATATSRIDQILGNTQTGASLSTALATFTADLQTLAAQADDEAAQISAADSAAALAQTVRAVAASVVDAKVGVENDIDDGIDAVNALLQQVSDLNTRTAASSAAGLDTTGLLDETDKAVLQLATYIDVRMARAENGTVRISTGEALTLVDNARPTQFARDADGKLIVANDGNGEVDVIAAGLVTSGSLAALFQARDTLLPQVSGQLDRFAAQLASTLSDTTTAGTAVTSGAASGQSIDLSDLSSGNTAQLVWKDAGGASHTVTFVKVTSASSLPVPADATLDPNDTVVGVDFSGGMSSVVTQIQSALGSGFTVSNPSGSTLQILDDGAAGTTDVTALTKTVTATATQSGNPALAVFVDADGLYTGSYDGASQRDGFATRIRINDAIAADPSLLVQYGPTTANADATRVTHLQAAVMDDTADTALGGGSTVSKKTLADYANSMVAYWAGQKSSADTAHSNQSVVQANLQSSMASISSVSTDQELAKLIQLQSTYAANAQVLSTLRDMLNTLVNSI